MKKSVFEGHDNDIEGEALRGRFGERMRLLFTNGAISCGESWEFGEIPGETSRILTTS